MPEKDAVVCCLCDRCGDVISSASTARDAGEAAYLKGAHLVEDLDLKGEFFPVALICRG